MDMDRRQFIAAATGVVSLAQTTGALPPAKTIRTNVLEIGYHESGAASGIPVLLLHGFPDDAHAYDGVAPQLAKAGHRQGSRAIRAQEYRTPHRSRDNR